MSVLVIRAALALLVLAGALAAAPASTAANRPNGLLDQIVSEAAGKPATLYCEDDGAVWDANTRQFLGVAGTAIDGFASVGGTVAYVSPLYCRTLHDGLLYGYREAGLLRLTRAVLVALHEGFHLRGLADEGATDCAALPLVVPILERYFGLGATISATEARTVWRSLRRKIAGKWRTIRYRATVLVSTSVPNPEYARAAALALSWHRAMPPAYQGTC